MCDEKNCFNYRKDGCVTGCVEAAGVSNSRLIDVLSRLEAINDGNCKCHENPQATEEAEYCRSCQAGHVISEANTIINEALGKIGR